MNRFEDRMKPVQTPLEATEIGSLETPRDSGSETPANFETPVAVTHRAGQAYRDTAETPVRNRKKSETPAACVTYDEYAALEGITRKAVTTRVARGKIVAIDTGEPCRNKVRKVIPISYLRPAARQRWARQHTTTDPHGAEFGAGPAEPVDPPSIHLPVPSEQGGSAPSSVASEGALERRPRAVGQAPPSRRQKAGPIKGIGSRLSTGLVPLLENGAVDEAAMIAIGRQAHVAKWHKCLAAVRELEAVQADAGHGGKLEALDHVARRHGVSTGSLRRWQIAWRKGGDVALVPKWGKSQGSKSIPRPLQRQLLAAWHTPQQPTYQEMFDLAVRWSIDRKRIAPCYKTIQRFLKKHRNETVATALRLGKKPFQDKCRFHGTRDPEQLPVNGVWCGDHRLGDVMVIMPDGSIGRPWGTVFLDLCSGRYVGWVIRETPTSDGVAATLRRATLGWQEPGLDGQMLTFEPCGLPDVLYLDNGKEFVGGAMAAHLDHEVTEADFALTDEAVATIFNTLGVGRVRAIPYAAWSKPIESSFKSWSNAENLLCGWTGRDAKRKPEILAKLIDRMQLLTFEQYKAWFATHAWQWNHTHTLGTRSQVPMAYYADHTPRLPDPAQLDTLLLRATRRKVHNHGLTLAGLGRFVCEDWQFVAMVGHEVEVRYQLDDPSWVVAIDPRTGNRWTLDRVPEGDDWAMMYGREPDEAFRQAQRIRTTQRQIVTTAAQAVRREGVEKYLDPTGTWRAASQNITPPAERKSARRQVATQPQRQLTDRPPSPPARENPMDRLLASDAATRRQRQAAIDALGEPADATSAADAPAER